MDFNIGDRVRVARTYPSDRDYPIPHELDVELWGCIGIVVASDRDWCDDKYVFVLPEGALMNNWPHKERFDPLPYWHFYPQELEKL